MKQLLRRVLVSVFTFSVLLVGLGALALGVFFWAGPSPEARGEQLLAAQRASWDSPADHAALVDSLRRGNPEWDLMWRTFTVLSALDVALARPDEADEWVAFADSILLDTIALETEHGHGHFLLPYANRGTWKDPDHRSVFVDGEIALMVAARRLVRDDAAMAALHRERIAWVERAFVVSPDGLPESYPDEVWMFCVTNALVALTMGDVLDGTDHQATVDRFMAQAKGPLLDPKTGLLGSEFTTDAGPLDGTEGSSLWLVAKNLQLLDPVFAQGQYQGGIDALQHSLFGMGWATEWGTGWVGTVDVDSGPIVPLLEASPSSSGFALVASRSFEDEHHYAQFTRGLRAADLLLMLDPRLAAMAEAPMGDAILLHGLTNGPLWAEVRRRKSS